VELPAPEAAAVAVAEPRSPRRPQAAGSADPPEAEEDFERRATGEAGIARSNEALDLELPGREQAASAGPLEAIELYDRILSTYPTYPHNDQVFYQKSRAYDELVQSLLSEVSEEDRILLMLKEVEGLSLKELEQVYNVNENALKVRLYRARQRVLKAYERSKPGTERTEA
jgi:DNA-directed RNA polymerase specialized sigma24 family protein